MTFQRARTEEQREIRRRAILDTASAMLDEMPVAAVTLNELSRRVGLAKPNVLRYFESREAVLLELLDRFLQEWLTELAGELAAGIDENLPMTERAAAVAEILSRSLSGRVVLCDLFGAQGSVLEHNVSVEVVARYKRASLDRLTTMTALIQKYLPELGENATLFSLQTMVMAERAVGVQHTPTQPAGGLPGRARPGPLPPGAEGLLEAGPDRNPPGRTTPPLTCVAMGRPRPLHFSRSGGQGAGVPKLGPPTLTTSDSASSVTHCTANCLPSTPRSPSGSVQASREKPSTTECR